MTTRRDYRSAGEALLLLSLSDRYAIAKAIIACDVVALKGAADLVETDVPRALATTDPARYRALRTAITNYRIRGYEALNPRSRTS